MSCSLQVVTHAETYRWQRDLEVNAKEDHFAVINYLSESSNAKIITDEVLSNQGALIPGIMKFMQNVSVTRKARIILLTDCQLWFCSTESGRS
jgi:hypothetical protein